MSGKVSEEEEEAEQLYYAVITHTLTKKAACILARSLESRSPVAAQYLRWLLARAQWPTQRWNTS